EPTFSHPNIGPPVVRTATPARRRSIVIRPVIPRPAAAFSPFTTMKSTPNSCFSLGNASITAFRPGSPMMSPKNKSRSIEPTRVSLSYIDSRRYRIKFAMPPSLLFALPLFGLLPVVCFSQKVTPLSQPPRWERLNLFQQTITHDEFLDLLDSVYAPDHGPWFQIAPGEVTISENATDRFVLRFAETPEGRRPIARYWKSVSDLGAND